LVAAAAAASQQGDECRYRKQVRLHAARLRSKVQLQDGSPEQFHPLEATPS
jgi:hypothetical protein